MTRNFWFEAKNISCFKNGYEIVKDLDLKLKYNENIILIRLQNKSNQESIETVNSVKNLIQDKVVEFRRSEFVGPTISSELLYRGFQAVSFALISILIYIWLRFEWQFGFGAVVALTHDVLFTLGPVSYTHLTLPTKRIV